MYIATCYVRINGTVYVPGECIEEEIPKEKLRWLLEAGAIYIPAPEPPADVESPEEESGESVRKDADGMSEDAEDSEGDDEEDTEAFEEEEAPEIDVMAGIVAQPEKTSRKSAERRKK